jgi:hypothetical protein
MDQLHTKRALKDTGICAYGRIILNWLIKEQNGVQTGKIWRGTGTTNEIL